MLPDQPCDLAELNEVTVIPLEVILKLFRFGETLELNVEEFFLSNQVLLEVNAQMCTKFLMIVVLENISGHCILETLRTIWTIDVDKRETCS